MDRIYSVWKGFKSILDEIISDLVELHNKWSTRFERQQLIRYNTGELPIVVSSQISQRGFDEPAWNRAYHALFPSPRFRLPVIVKRRIQIAPTTHEMAKVRFKQMEKTPLHFDSKAALQYILDNPNARVHLVQVEDTVQWRING